MVAPARKPVPPFATMNPQQARVVHEVLFDRDIVEPMESRGQYLATDEITEALKGMLILAAAGTTTGLAIGWAGHVLWRRWRTSRLLPPC